MDSRLLKTLNAQASVTTDPIVWARAVCRGASHFARHGMTLEALDSIDVVRKQFNNELHHEIASWLMLAEGVLHFFQSRPKEAYEKIRRAYGLAAAMETDSVLPTCAAWMAHIEFNDCRYERMAIYIEESLLSAAKDDHQARARASLVLGNAFMLAGDFSYARPWYEKARLCAAVEGDETTLSAMLYNVAAFRASNVRLADSFGIETSKEAHRAGMETSSSYVYDHMIATQVFNFSTKMLRGLLFTIDKKFVEAMEIFKTVELLTLPARMHGLVHVDMAWCAANLGFDNQCTLHSKMAAEKLADISEDDDAAYVKSRLSQIAYKTGRDQDGQEYLTSSHLHLDMHRDFQSSLLKNLLEIKTS